MAASKKEEKASRASSGAEVRQECDICRFATLLVLRERPEVGIGPWSRHPGLSVRRITSHITSHPHQPQTAAPDTTIQCNNQPNNMTTNSSPWRRLPLGLLLGSTTLVWFAFSGLQAILDLLLSNRIGFAATAANTLVAAFIAAYSLLAPLGGWLGRRHNARMQLVAQLVFLVGGSLPLLAAVARADWFGGAQAPGTRALACVSLLVAACGWGCLQTLQPVLVANAANASKDSSEEDRSAISSTSESRSDGPTDSISTSGTLTVTPTSTGSQKAAGSIAAFYFMQNVGTLAGESITPQLRASRGPNLALVVLVTVQTAALLVFLLAFPWLRVHSRHGRASDGSEQAAGSINSARPNRRESCDRAVSDEQTALLSPPPTPPPPPGTPPPGSSSPSSASSSFAAWRSSPNGQVMLRIGGVYALLLVWWAVFNQQSNTWVQQGKSMDSRICLASGGRRCVSVAPDAMPAANDLLDLVLIAALQTLVYPLLERRAGRPLRPLKKIEFGILMAALSFVVAGFLQLHLDSQPAHSVSLAWQLPQYWFISMSEVLVSIPALELGYNEAPPALRTQATSLFFVSQGLGNLLDTVLFQSLRQAPAWLRYFVFAALALVAAVLFDRLPRLFFYKEAAEVEGERDGVHTSTKSR